MTDLLCCHFVRTKIEADLVTDTAGESATGSCSVSSHDKGCDLIRCWSQALPGHSQTLRFRVGITKSKEQSQLVIYRMVEPNSGRIHCRGRGPRAYELGNTVHCVVYPIGALGGKSIQH